VYDGETVPRIMNPVSVRRPSAHHCCFGGAVCGKGERPARRHAGNLGDVVGADGLQRRDGVRRDRPGRVRGGVEPHQADLHRGPARDHPAAHRYANKPGVAQRRQKATGYRVGQDEPDSGDPGRMPTNRNGRPSRNAAIAHRSHQIPRGKAVRSQHTQSGRATLV
jgi:hypothetical protein